MGRNVDYISDMKTGRTTPKTQDRVFVRGTKTAGGREVWLLSGSGTVRNVTTSTSSAAIMDDAVRVYSKAMKRLAKR
jgi:hypothetical protein